MQPLGAGMGGGPYTHGNICRAIFRRGPPVSVGQRHPTEESCKGHVFAGFGMTARLTGLPQRAGGTANSIGTNGVGHRIGT